MSLPVNQIINGDCLKVMRELPDESVDCCVTSPPYWGLRDYGVDGQIGLEDTPETFTAKMVDVFREVRRVLRDDGTLWLNLGDSYASKGGFRGKDEQSAPCIPYQENTRSVGVPRGLKPKDLCGIPWRVAFALQADGWHLRQDIIWHKPNPMPESVRDRCTKAHEYIFLLSKSERYYYDLEAIKEPCKTDPASAAGMAFGSMSGKYNTTGTSHAQHVGHKWEYCPTRNKRSVWTVTTKPYSEAHFATYPPDLIEPCILAGCPEGGIVLDPFMGAGTTALVAYRNHRDYIGAELNADYCEIARRRVAAEQERFALFETAEN